MIEIWGKPACPYCVKAVNLCKTRQLEYTYKSLGTDFTREQIFETLPTARTFLQIIIGGHKVGGYEQMVDYIENTNYNGTGHTI